jgi:hypothetical protein
MKIVFDTEGKDFQVNATTHAWSTERYTEPPTEWNERRL